MNKREFLKATGLLGITSVMPLGKILASGSSANEASETCSLIPSETAGPFPLDLTTNSHYFRQDIREDRTGTLLKLKLKIIGDGNCLSLQNARVNIWQCDKGGSYSGYSTQVGNTTNTVGQTWLRGYQITDANGEVEFVTIFPGWYNGRICHIHFQVYISSSYSAISQLTFNVADKQALYAANPTDYTKGADPTTLAGDNIFSDGYAYQVATLTPNSTNDGYDSYLEVTVRGNGTTGMGNIEKENAKQFLLGQNFPNPYVSETVIPVELIHPADVTLAFYDLQGRNVASVVKPNLAPGRHDVPIDLKALGLSAGNYACQIVVKNSDGIFQDFKMMTAAQ